MTEEAEIYKEFEDEGYSFVVSEKIEPSYYRLTEDGTVIRSLMRVHGLAEHHDGKGFEIISTNEVSALQFRKNRRPELFDEQNIKLTKDDIEDDDVDYEVLRENFSVYKLSNGKTLSLKTAVGQITKFSKHNKNGESIYKVTPTPIMRIKDTKKK